MAAPILLSAQLLPDPRDSIILESKSVAPNLSGSPAFAVKVYITNKDSLTYMTLGIRESTIVGTAYALLNRDANGLLTFYSVVSNLTNTLHYNEGDIFVGYNETSPDFFVLAAGFDGINPETIEPPNLVRKPVWELRFRRTLDVMGQILLYSYLRCGQTSYDYFTNTQPRDIPVNFLPGVITVEYLKGDLNGDVMLSAADVVLILNCVLCSSCPPPPVGADECDLNCDGNRSAADIVLELYAVFQGRPFPC